MSVSVLQQKETNINKIFCDTINANVFESRGSVITYNRVNSSYESTYVNAPEVILPNTQLAIYPIDLTVNHFDSNIIFKYNGFLESNRNSSGTIEIDFKITNLSNGRNFLFSKYSQTDTYVSNYTNINNQQIFINHSLVLFGLRSRIGMSVGDTIRIELIVRNKQSLAILYNTEDSIMVRSMLEYKNLSAPITIIENV